jgi:hypothetical protein
MLRDRSPKKKIKKKFKPLENVSLNEINSTKKINSDILTEFKIHPSKKEKNLIVNKRLFITVKIKKKSTYRIPTHPRLGRLKKEKS